jgi:hypothetical protein
MQALWNVDVDAVLGNKLGNVSMSNISGAFLRLLFLNINKYKPEKYTKYYNTLKNLSESWK